MHGVGESEDVYNFSPSHLHDNSILCLSWGEVDSRANIKKQIEKGRIEDKIIEELVSKYFQAILKNIGRYKNTIIVGIVPPIYYNSIHPDRDFCMGSDEERRRYVDKINKLLEYFCELNDYIFFAPYDDYTNPDGSIKSELSDGICHLGNTDIFLENFYTLVQRIQGLA
jgi:hypothetical protein